jgi:chromosome partitioning protein
MIVVVGGIKGGSGKTTIATNLAIIKALNGSDLLLIDADDQETATDFSILRNDVAAARPRYTNIKLTGAAVRTETQQLCQKYEDIIIDTGGRDTSSQRAALSVADIVLIPFVPRSFDIWTLGQIETIITEMRSSNPSLRAYSFLNRADPRSQDNAGAAQLLQENISLQFIDTPLITRKAFGNASAQGLSVVEISPSDSKALDEIMNLYRYIYDIKSE